MTYLRTHRAVLACSCSLKACVDISQNSPCRLGMLVQNSKLCKLHTFQLLFGIALYPHTLILHDSVKPSLGCPSHRHTRRQHKEPRKSNPSSVLMGLNPQPCNCVRRLTRKRVSAGAGVLVVRKPSSKLLAFSFPKDRYFHATKIWGGFLPCCLFRLS